MPAAMLKVLGEYNEECNKELICEMCNEYKDEEDLQHVLLKFKHPEGQYQLVSAFMNMCSTCRHNIINNSTMNRIHDTFTKK